MQFGVYELAFITIGTFSRRSLVPLLAHFSFVILVVTARAAGQLVMSMCIAAFALELAVARLQPIATELGFVVHAKIFNILKHLFTRSKHHLLLLTARIRWSGKHDVLIHLHLSDDATRIIRMLGGHLGKLRYMIGLLLSLGYLIVLMIQTRHNEGSRQTILFEVVLNLSRLRIHLFDSLD